MVTAKRNGWGALVVPEEWGETETVDRERLTAELSCGGVCCGSTKRGAGRKPSSGEGVSAPRSAHRGAQGLRGGLLGLGWGRTGAKETQRAIARTF